MQLALRLPHARLAARKVLLSALQVLLQAQELLDLERRPLLRWWTLLRGGSSRRVGGRGRVWRHRAAGGALAVEGLALRAEGGHLLLARRVGALSLPLPVGPPALELLALLLYPQLLGGQPLAVSSRRLRRGLGAGACGSGRGLRGGSGRLDARLRRHHGADGHGRRAPYCVGGRDLELDLRFWLQPLHARKRGAPKRRLPQVRDGAELLLFRGLLPKDQKCPDVVGLRHRATVCREGLRADVQQRGEPLAGDRRR
mmetsp:Transcript_23481/g.63886  ORF Transcript_23481/g.63886 Transcript_23481/m.63886 type:complete len:256 (+) Transcript_23481:414-1181(+)